MRTIVDLLITAMLLVGISYTAKNLFFSIEKATIKKVSQGLSSTERFAEILTDGKLSF